MSWTWHIGEICGGKNDEPFAEILWAKDIFLLSVKVKGDGISVAQMQLQVIASH